MKTLFLAVSLLASPAAAETPASRDIVLTIKGIVCSFCAYGIEKNLSKAAFLDRSKYGKDGVLVEIEKGKVTLAAITSEAINFRLIDRAIRKGGYDLEAVHLHLFGTIEFTQDGTVLTSLVNGQSYRLTDAEGKPYRRKTKGSASVHAILRGKTLRAAKWDRPLAVEVTLEEAAEAAEVDAHMLDAKIMPCAKCARRLESELKNIPGVLSAEADHIKKEARVEYDPKRASKKRLRKLISEAGFKAKLKRRSSD